MMNNFLIKKWIILFCLGFSAIFAITIAVFDYHLTKLELSSQRASSQLFFAVTMKADTSGTAQVFYNVGNGYSEEKSSALNIAPNSTLKYLFPISWEHIDSIRFDPLNKSGSVEIKDIQIENHNGAVIKKFALNQLKPFQQITECNISNNSCSFNIPQGANDPIIEIENSSYNKLVFKDSLARLWIPFIVFIVSTIVLIGFCIFFKTVTRSLYLIFSSKWFYYFILCLITIFICFSNPFLKIPYDMWERLILIDSLCRYNSAFCFYPEDIWVKQISWFYVWAKFFKLFSIEDFFLRAKIIHVAQFLFSFYAMLYVSKVFLKNLFKEIDTLNLKWLSLFSVFIWFTIYGTFSVEYQQSWIMWYSINYQITLVLYWLCTALTIKLFLENPNNKYFLVFVLISCLAFILLWHAMEFIYYLIFVVFFVIIYLKKIISYFKQHKIAFIIICFLLLLFILSIISYEIFSLVKRLPQLFLITDLSSLCSKLENTTNDFDPRAYAAFNSLAIISLMILGLSIPLSIWKRKLISKKFFILLFLLSSTFLIPFIPYIQNLAILIVGSGVVWRFIFISSLFLIVPTFCFMLFERKISLIYFSIFLIIVSSFLISRYLSTKHVYFKNVESIYSSLSRETVGVHFSDKQITSIGAKVENLAKSNQSFNNEPILFYAPRGIDYIIRGVFGYFTFCEQYRTFTQEQFDNITDYNKITYKEGIE